MSRVVTSLGWRPHHEQVGQTGSRVTPDLYLACGISGAIQHWAGMSSSKTIIAVNNDPDAPMVTKAHYAVIGDLHEIVPAINDELRRRRGRLSVPAGLGRSSWSRPRGLGPRRRDVAFCGQARARRDRPGPDSVGPVETRVTRRRRECPRLVVCCNQS